jgi:hypothetical protein
MSPPILGAGARFVISLNNEAIEDLVQACGIPENISHSTTDVNSANFPNLNINGAWECDVSDSSSRSSIGVKKEIQRDEWVVANAHQGLAFVEKYPQSQKRSPIAFLGSSCYHSYKDTPYENSFVLVACMSGKDRILGLASLNIDWVPVWRFLRVRPLVVSVP